MDGCVGCLYTITKNDPNARHDKLVNEGIIGCLIETRNRSKLQEYVGKDAKQRLARAEAWIDFYEAKFGQAGKKLAPFVHNQGTFALPKKDLALYIACTDGPRNKQHHNVRRILTKLSLSPRDHLVMMARQCYAKHNERNTSRMAYVDFDGGKVTSGGGKILYAPICQ